jgi:hypothetical protein
MKLPIVFIALSVASTAAYAAKPCGELKTEIAAKLDAKHVASYTLEIVPNDQVGDRKVVGSCDSGTKKIVYERHADAHAPENAGSVSSGNK